MQFSTLFFVAAFLPVFIFIYGIAPDVKGKISSFSYSHSCSMHFQASRGWFSFFS